MFWGHQRAAFVRGTRGDPEGGVNRVRFRRGGEIERRLARQVRLLANRENRTILGGDGLTESAFGRQGRYPLWPCGPAAVRYRADPRRLPACGQASTAPHGDEPRTVMRRRDEIVVAVLALVVDWRAALHDLHLRLGVERRLARRRSPRNVLGEVDRPPASPSAMPNNTTRASSSAAASASRPPRHGQKARSPA